MTASQSPSPAPHPRAADAPIVCQPPHSGLAPDLLPGGTPAVAPVQSRVEPAIEVCTDAPSLGDSAQRPSTDAGPAEAAPVTHYENFPVASWLCPPHLRQPIAAIYAFARTADDIADEGDASAEARLDDLAQYQADLHAAAEGRPTSGRWNAVFGPLQTNLRSHALPVPLLADLLSAFAQDVRKSRDGAGYADRAELLDYCRRSANPVGRLLLHLYGVTTPEALAESDAICTALQLINFWQDLSEDLPRGRYYLPEADRLAHAAEPTDLHALHSTPATVQLVTASAAWARALMDRGAPLVHRLPGRAGWELRLVVQGGLRILDKIDALHGGSLHTRPTLRGWDWAVMLGRAVTM